MEFVWTFCRNTNHSLFMCSTFQQPLTYCQVPVWHQTVSHCVACYFNVSLNSFALFTTTNKNVFLVLSLFHSWTHLFVLEKIYVDVAGGFLCRNRIMPAWACCLRWILFSKSKPFPCIDFLLTQLVLSTDCSSLLRLANFFAYTAHILSPSIFSSSFNEWPCSSEQTLHVWFRAGLGGKASVICQ